MHYRPLLRYFLRHHATYYWSRIIENEKKIWNYVGITESEKLEGGLEKTSRFSGST